MITLADELLSVMPGFGTETIAGHIRSLSTVEFCEQCLWIQDKNDQLVPFIPNRAQRELAEILETNNRVVCLKARQLGISTIIAAYVYKRTLESGVRSVTMAHDDDTTQKLRRMAKLFHENMPEDRTLNRTQDNAAITSYGNLGEVTIKTAGSGVGGRGGTYGGVFHADEAGFWKNAEEVFKGAIQGVPDTGTIVIASTANGTYGLFYDIVQGAKAGANEYKFIFFPWWYDDGYKIPLEPDETLTYTPEEQHLVSEHGLTAEQIKWRRRKRAEPGMGEDFVQEYPEDPETCFLTSGESAFPGVHAVMFPPEQTEPVPGHEYVAGLDWGQDNNYTALSIFDKTERREVHIERWRKMSYGDIRAEVVRVCRYWNVSDILPEQNSMASNIEELQKDFEKENYSIRMNVFVMTNAGKHELVTGFKIGYQSEGMKLLNTPWAKQEMNTFVKKQSPATLIWTYQAERKGSSRGNANENDDGVIARMLSWHGVIGIYSFEGFVTV